MQYSILNPWNPGILDGRLPNDLFQDLKQRVLDERNKRIKYNDSLVAYIKEEYQYPHQEHPQLCSYLLEMYSVWRHTFGVDTNLNNDQIPIVNDVWVNHQRRGEYNPNHNHGGKASFVIWVNIPYDIDEELKVDYYTKKNDNLKKAAFEFTYSTLTNGVSTMTLWINKSDEGRILMFPNQMIHCVYPFTTSDGVRISVAGNMWITNKF